MNALTTAAAAASLGISARRVRALIKDKRIRAVPFGRAWLISPAEIERIRPRIQGKAGRPPAPKKSG